MTSLTRRELAQTLLATTAVAALVPVWSKAQISGDILDPHFQRIFIDTWEALTASDLHVEFNAILGKI